MSTTDNNQAEQLKTAVEAILAEISQEREREIISRRFGLFDRRETLEQIGEMLGIPVGTVRSRIARARDRLRDHLAAAGHPVPEPTTLLPKDTPS